MGMPGSSYPFLWPGLSSPGCSSRASGTFPAGVQKPTIAGLTPSSLVASGSSILAARLITTAPVRVTTCSAFFAGLSVFSEAMSAWSSSIWSRYLRCCLAAGLAWSFFSSASSCWRCAGVGVGAGAAGAGTTGRGAGTTGRGAGIGRGAGSTAVVVVVTAPKPGGGVKAARVAEPSPKGGGGAPKYAGAVPEIAGKAPKFMGAGASGMAPKVA